MVAQKIRRWAQPSANSSQPAGQGMSREEEEGLDQGRDGLLRKGNAESFRNVTSIYSGSSPHHSPLIAIFRDSTVLDATQARRNFLFSNGKMFMDDNHKVNRREFLGAAVAGAVTGMAATKFGSQVMAAAQPATQPAKRPNILVIMTDEHNARVMGCAGDPIIRTATMDSLAQRGVMFDNCYCNSPLCAPSRHAFTASRYVSRVGVWNNECWMPSDDISSIARVLNAQGYDSILCGKMHFAHTRRYGFTEIWGTKNDTIATGKGRRRKADDLHEGPGYSERFQNFKVGDKSGVLIHDENVTSHSVDFLKNRKADDKPFFMISGFLAPHFPLIVPKAYHDVYKGRVPMPDVPPGSLEAQVLNYHHLRVGFKVDHVPPHVVQHSRELYYGLTQWVDEQIGQVLSALAASEAGRDTIVIYTADHGENKGQHGMWWKNCMYDSATRVPLIDSYPQRWACGQRRGGVCSLLDVARTVVELGGGVAPGDWNGQSLVGVLDDPKAKWKNMAVAEYYAGPIASGYAMIRSGEYKYTYHTAPDAKHPPQHELYDLNNDPGEVHNLAGGTDQRDRVAAMHETMVAEIGESPDQTELRCRAGFHGYANVEVPAKKRGGEEEE